MPGLKGHSESGSGDLHVALRRSGEQPADVSRIELRYYNGSLQVSECFDRIEQRFGGTSRRMLDEAIRQLFSELKFRLKGNQDFHVLYSDNTARRIVESEAARVAGADASQTRLVDALVMRGRLRDEVPVETDNNR